MYIASAKKGPNVSQYLEISDDVKKHSKNFGKKHDVSSALHEEDLILKFIVEHPSFSGNIENAIEYYFNNALDSAKKLRDLINGRIPIDKNKHYSLLEFASGFDCVTRHLPRTLPEFEITACDIHEKAMSFIKDELKVNTLLSKTCPEEFPSNKKYDVIFALSFFSHMPQSSWIRWVKALYSNLNDEGLLIFTAHGKQSVRLMGDMPIPKNGFFFTPSSEQADLDGATYGSTVSLKFWSFNEISNAIGDNIVDFREAYWWGHQDVYVIQKQLYSNKVAE